MLACSSPFRMKCSWHSRKGESGPQFRCRSNSMRACSTARSNSKKSWVNDVPAGQKVWTQVEQWMPLLTPTLDFTTKALGFVS